MNAVPYILLGWILTVAACYSLGAMFLARCPAVWSREESVALRFVAGAGIYSLLVFLLGIGHLYYRGVFIAVPIVLLACAWKTGALTLPAERLAPLPVFWGRTLWLAAPFSILYLSNAMAPEASPDGSAYHLGLVARYYREHALVPVPTNMYAALSQGMEMLFQSAYAVGRQSAAALVHFTYLMALPWLLICFGRRYDMPAAGVTAALLVFLSPVVGIDGISAYNDVAAASVWFALFMALRRMEELPRERGLVILAGVLGGSAFGMKYTLFPALLLAAAGVIWVHRRSALRPLFALAGTASIFIAPWLVRNAIWWHNPLAPFFNNWFPNPYWLYWFELGYRRHMSMYSLTSRLQIPMEVTVHGAQLNGLLGPVFLIAPIAILAFRHPEGRRLLAAALFAVAVYPSNIGTRFLIPALPFVAMGMGLSLGFNRWIAVSVLTVHAVLSWPNVIPTYASQWAWRLQKVTWKEALRLRSEDNYILSLLPTYGLARKVEELVSPGHRVMGFSQLPESYMNREFLVGFQSAEGLGLRDIFLTPLVRERQSTRQVRLQIPAGKHRALRVVQNRNESSGQWTVTEMRVFHGADELVRSPFWRLRAKPSLHEVQKAFDGSYVTRWTTDKGRYDGMYLEVDFGREELVDRATLSLTTDQPWDSYHVEVPSAGGGWTRLKTGLHLQEVTTPLGLRRAVVEEFLRRNVQYLVVADSDFGSSDLILNRAVWGMDELANVGDLRLYRLVPREEFEARRKGGK